MKVLISILSLLCLNVCIGYADRSSDKSTEKSRYQNDSVVGYKPTQGFFEKNNATVLLDSINVLNKKIKELANEKKS